MSTNQFIPSGDLIDVDGLFADSMGSIRWQKLPKLPTEYRKRKLSIGFEGQVKTENTDITLHLCFTNSFPYSLPVIYLKPANALGYIPHVEEDGYVCYTQTTGQYLDFDNPKEIIEEAIRRTVKTLEDGYTKKNKNDFLNGFAEYWNRLPHPTLMHSVLAAGTRPQKIVLSIAAQEEKRSNHLMFVGEDEQAIRTFSHRLRKTNFTTYSALYIPLTNIENLLPPQYGTFWSLNEVKQIIEQHTTKEVREELHTLVRKINYKNKTLIIFSLPRPNGGHVFFGIYFVGIQKAHPLQPDSSGENIKPCYAYSNG